MITLRELAAWEDRVAQAVARATGAVEERDRQLEQAGVYGEYPAIFAAYLALGTPESPEGLEALRRATFLAWYAGVEPACFSGISGLPEAQTRSVCERLDALFRAGPADAQLAWMVPWYNSVFEYPFALYPGLASLRAYLARADHRAWERIDLTPDELRGRGQMGRYWSSLVRAA